MYTGVEDFNQFRIKCSFHLHKFGQTLCFQQIKEVEPLLREPFQVHILGDSYILHSINHLIIILLAFIGEPCIHPIESSLRAFTLFSLGSRGFLLSSGVVARHF